MRFIHLTSSKRLRSIARSGIRMGAGRRGRGVYAVPFVLLRFPAKFRSGPQQAKPPITSDPRSASHLWSWWCRGRGTGGHATIVFDAPADAWPADLYLLTVSGSRRSVIAKARELGLEVDLEDVEIEPFVPASILAEDDLERFFAALQRHDAAQEQALTELRRSGQTLRYLARIDPRGGDGGRASIRVGPIGVPASHPATRLRGSEAFVAFTTERYAEYPLIVQGAGAGGAVTAAGVLADVLALSQTLRGR